jgi:hypothetical protein
MYLRFGGDESDEGGQALDGQGQVGPRWALAHRYTAVTAVRLGR